VNRTRSSLLRIIDGNFIKYLLDVVIRECASIFQLLTGEDQALLVWRNAFFILDLRLDIVDRVARFNFEGDGFTRQGLYEAGGGMLVAEVVGEMRILEGYICTVRRNLLVLPLINKYERGVLTDLRPSEFVLKKCQWVMVMPPKCAEFHVSLRLCRGLPGAPTHLCSPTSFQQQHSVKMQKIFGGKSSSK